MVTKKPFCHIFLKWVIFSLPHPQQEPRFQSQVTPAFPSLPRSLKRGTALCLPLLSSDAVTGRQGAPSSQTPSQRPLLEHVLPPTVLCWFPLGNRPGVDRSVQAFLEVFSEGAS